MSSKDRQYLNEVHRKNSEACIKEVAYWLEHPLSYEEAKRMFEHQGDELESLRKSDEVHR
jgi:hypothetical protein